MDFRDPDQRAVIHLSPVSGTQRVVITLIDDLGAATAITFMLVFVNPPPVADFSFHPGEPATLEDVNFMSRARDNGVIVSHRWEVEDAEYHTPHMVHTFSTPGLHPITLTVTDDEGLRGIWYHWVLVANRPPVLTMERMRVVAGREVSLTVQASDPDGWIVRYLMELPSGEVLNRSSPTFTVAFPEGGVYHLNITVVDDHGAVASGVMEVHVLRKEGGSALPFPGAASLVLSLGAGLLMASFRRRASGNSRTGTVVRTTGHTRTFGTIRENAHQEHQNLRDHQSHREH